MAELPVHSRIGASSMHRWAACPGSVKLSEGIPSRTSAYAEEGTLAHDVAACILKNETPLTVPDDEMLTAVRVYVDAVLGAYGESPDCSLEVEHRFDLSKIHPGLYGTADAVVFNPHKKLLQVFDYKHGAGIPVGVEENEQLMYYGLGALLSTKFICTEVELIIVQPRCQHPDGDIRRWRFDSFNLLDFAADLKEFAKRTEDPNAPLVPGEHCRFCPAAGVCPAIHQKALAVAKEEFSPSFTYDPEKLAQTLTWLPALEGWIKNVREFAYAEAEHGRPPPGWKLVQKRATRKWRDEEYTSKIVHEVGLLQLLDMSLKSVAQAEKLMGKELFNKHFEKHITQESSGLVLAPANDKRPEAKTSAKDQFTVIEENKPAQITEDLFG